MLNGKNANLALSTELGSIAENTHYFGFGSDLSVNSGDAVHFLHSASRAERDNFER